MEAARRSENLLTYRWVRAIVENVQFYYSFSSNWKKYPVIFLGNYNYQK